MIMRNKAQVFKAHYGFVLSICLSHKLGKYFFLLNHLFSIYIKTGIQLVQDLLKIFCMILTFILMSSRKTLSNKLSANKYTLVLILKRNLGLLTF